MKTLILNELMALENSKNQKVLSHFFKTSKGEYGEGDLFLGIKVPEQRLIAKKYYKDISLEDILVLLKNKYHEVRLTALIMLDYKMIKADIKEQKIIYYLYLNNTKYINNWDLVDLTAPNIVGSYLFYIKDYSILEELASRNNIWDQRIAIISTFYFIKNNEYDKTLMISLMLLNHKHDLIHKAVGWMLREVGKRDYNVLYNFLIKYYKKMPRTMLRYAIEKFDEDIRIKFLKGQI
ncbi:MAG: DNA alkylation repair protein [Bacilli bacterium]|nr:DNA alkylation repair protein [Bacilli bacterium]